MVANDSHLTKTGTSTALLLAAWLAAHVWLPSVEALYVGMEEDLPVLTRYVFSSYPFWYLFSALPLVIAAASWHSEQGILVKYRDHIHQAFILCAAILALSLPLAIYLPLFLI